MYLTLVLPLILAYYLYPLNRVTKQPFQPL
nr:MAG TPA: hypothetical protein [Caudoviricetes sp.]